MKTSVIVNKSFQGNDIKKNVPIYPYSLNLYMKHPNEEIEMQELETYGLDRLKLLQKIDNFKIQHITDEDINESDNLKLLKIANESLPLNENTSSFASVRDMYEQRRKDYLSHYILRIAYCQTEELREWFVRQECSLFNIRWSNPSIRKDEKSEFIQSLNINLEMVSQKEKMNIKDYLEKLLAIKNPLYLKNIDALNADLQKKNYYKIKFEEVPDLVQSRQVVVKAGFAYIPENEVISVLITKYSEYLRESLEELAAAYNQMLKEDEDRVKPILTNLSRQYIDDAYSGPDNGLISHQDIPKLIGYFPLCMQHIQRNLQIEGHLRHGGRMQYGLFLKGIGVTLEESLKFWKKAFTKIPEDRFNKDYAYNIRHNYGKEGKGTSYSPYSCTKIIMGNPPGTGDHHGCPFRHASTAVLEKMLRQSGVKENHTAEICNLAFLKHYQLACTKMLQVITNSTEEEVENVTHPNRYFDQAYPESEYNKNKKQVNTQNSNKMELEP